jgi:hypothetical protein
MSNFFSFKWLTDFFHIITDLLHKANKEYVDISIKGTNVVKELVDNPVTDWAVKLTSTTADDKVLAWLKEKLPIILADQLAFKAITPQSTEADVQALMIQVIDTFGGLNDAQKEQLWTSIAANIYKQLEADLSDNNITFGEAAALVETGWQAWQKLHAKPATTNA